MCTCVKAKQTLESQSFPWVISDDHCYNLRFTAKQRGRKKKRAKQNKKLKQALEKGPVNHAKQQKGSQGKEWRHPGNNPGVKAERLEEEFSLLECLYNPGHSSATVMGWHLNTLQLPKIRENGKSVRKGFIKTPITFPF